MSQDLQRHQAVILVSDIVGYSRRMGRDEEGTLNEPQRHRFAVIDPTIGEHQGRIVKDLGDGLLVEFQTVPDAVDCAIAIQERISMHKTATGEGAEIFYRIGINRGEIIAADGDIFGDGVNIAARLQEVADPDGIAIASTVLADLKPDKQQGFKDLGAHRFKNNERPI